MSTYSTETRIWSIFQSAIFSAIQESKDNITVEAVAGSGKTTTIVESLKYCLGRTLFLAFGKEIAVELSKRVPAGVEARTLHSFGLDVLARNLPRRPTVDFRKHGGKVHSIAEKLMKGDKWHPMAPLVREAVEKAKNNLVHTAAEIVELMDKYGMDVQYPFTSIQVAEMAVRVLDICKRETAVIDGDDMVWLPVVLNLPVRSFDTVLVDESQDLNPVQIELVFRSVGKSGRVIVVGDPRQSIFAFRGADSSAMQKLSDKFNCVKLPLSVSYRCPAKIVGLAQKIVAGIESAPKAKEGTLALRSYDQLLEKVVTGDMVLCRTTAPLIGLYFSLLRAGRKSFVQGRDIGTGLIRFIEKFRARDLSDLTDKIRESTGNELQKLTEAGKETQAQQLTDKADAILELSLNVETIRELIQEIKNIFSQEGQGICLSTAHRAKGLEADNVWIIRGDLLPHPCARKAWQMEQEWNLAYVAVTRAKDSLFFVGSVPYWAADLVDRTECAK